MKFLVILVFVLEEVGCVLIDEEVLGLAPKLAVDVLGVEVVVLGLVSKF